VTAIRYATYMYTPGHEGRSAAIYGCVGIMNAKIVTTDSSKYLPMIPFIHSGLKSEGDLGDIFLYYKNFNLKLYEYVDKL